MFRLIVAELCIMAAFMLACEDITRAAHIRGQLINLIKTAINQHPAIFSLTEIGDNEIVSFRLAELGYLRSIPRTQKPSRLRCFTR